MDPIHPHPYAPSSLKSSVAWYTRPVTLVILAVLVAGLLFGARPENRAAVMMAAVNFAVICIACVRLVKHRRMSSLVPVLVLAWFALGWPLGTVLFGILTPDIYYPLPRWRSYMLDGNLRLQLATFVFVTTYVLTFLATRPRGESDLPMRPNADEARRLLAILVPVCLLTTMAIAVASVAAKGSALQYVALGTQKYIIGFYLVIGGLILYLRSSTILFLIGFLALATLFFFVGNARGQAARPVVLIVGGLLFLSAVKGRTKMLMMATIAIGGPILLVIGNTTRELMGSGGFSNFSARLQALANWKEVLGESSVVIRTFGRLFSTGGHAIITSSPERVPYMHFSLFAYCREIFSTLFIPQRIIYYAPYSETITLNNYGFHVIPGGHSVELSMIGSFWMVGGYLAVFLGAIAVGLFHSAIAHWIACASRRSVLKGAVFLAGLSAQLLWTQNLAFPSHVKVTVWSAAFAGLFYHLVFKPLARLQSRPTAGPPRYPYPNSTPSYPSTWRPSTPYERTPVRHL